MENKGISSQENDYHSSASSDELSWKLERYDVISLDTEKRAKAKKRNGEERMPTRRPDPNVYNRNALLARENRRKKKLYLESLERELQEARIANKALVKALKRQIKLSQQLEQQKKYYQNIIGNRPEISRVLAVLSNPELSPLEPNTSSSDIFSDCNSHKGDAPSDRFSSSSYDPEPVTSDFFQSGSVTDHSQNYLRDISSIDFSQLFTDFEDGGSFGNSSWDDAWNKDDDQIVSDLPSPFTECTKISEMLKDNVLTIFDDHCYMGCSSSVERPEIVSPPFADSTDRNQDINVSIELQGTCIHINPGKDSQFCPTCHWNSTSRNPPLQLLNDEMLL